MDHEENTHGKSGEKQGHCQDKVHKQEWLHKGESWLKDGKELIDGALEAGALTTEEHAEALADQEKWAKLIADRLSNL